MASRSRTDDPTGVYDALSEWRVALRRLEEARDALAAAQSQTDSAEQRAQLASDGARAAREAFELAERIAEATRLEADESARTLATREQQMGDAESAERDARQHHHTAQDAAYEHQRVEERKDPAAG